MGNPVPSPPGSPWLGMLTIATVLLWVFMLVSTGPFKGADWGPPLNDGKEYEPMCLGYPPYWEELGEKVGACGVIGDILELIKGALIGLC